MISVPRPGWRKRVLGTSPFFVTRQFVTDRRATGGSTPLA